MKVSKIWIGISSVLAVVLAVGMGGLASAQTGAPTGAPAQTGPHPVRISGNVTAVSGSSLTLSAKQGTITANISANTWIVVRNNGVAAQGTVADIATGKPATVAGMTTADDKVIDARMITQGASKGGAAGKPMPNQQALTALASHVAAGTITGINGNTIVLKGDNVAQVTVQTSADTLILSNGVSGLSSLKVGDRVQIFGEPVKTGGAKTSPPATPGTRPQAPASRTLNAWAVRVDSGTSKVELAHVDSVNGNTLTVKTRGNRGGLTVSVNAGTGYRSATVANKTVTISPATLADVKAGSNLLLEGVAGADGKTFSADAVIVLLGTTK